MNGSAISKVLFSLTAVVLVSTVVLTAEKATAQQTPAPRNPNAPYPVVIAAPFKAGLFGICDSTDSVVVVNCWNGVVNNVNTSVSAGVETDNPQQGILIISANGAVNYMPTPVSAGPVQILAAVNGILTVVSTNNTYVFTFDAGAQTFTATSNVSAAPTSGHECDGVFNGAFTGKLTIDDRQTCIFVGGTISGDIEERGGNLVLSGVALNGGLHVTGGTYSIQPTTTIAGDVEIENVRGAVDPGQICGATLQRNLRFHHNTVGVQIGASDSCAGNTIGGNLHVHDDSGSTVIDFNTVTGNLDDNDNKGPTQVFKNTIGKDLSCHGNRSITGGGNSALQKEDQCAAF